MYGPRKRIKLMSEDHAEIDQLPARDETAALKSYRRRISLIVVKTECQQVGGKFNTLKGFAA
jgi:hypothetical protein